MRPLDPGPAGSGVDPVRLAEQSSDLVRALTRAVSPESRELRYPGDVYLVLGMLARLADELPATLDHLARWLVDEAAHGRVEGDSGLGSSEPLDNALLGMQTWLTMSHATSQELRDALVSAQTAIRDLRQPGT